MPTPLEDIDWLTRSSHRVSILDALGEGPKSRSELEAITGANRVTISRCLGDLEERAWLERDGDDYRLTALGDLVVEDLSRLVETTATTHKLREIVPALPVEAFDFDLRRLADAEIVEPSATNTTKPLKTSAGFLTDADDVRVVSAQWDALHMRTAVEFLRNNPGAYHARLVFCGDAIASIRSDPEMADWFHEVAELTPSDFFHHPDPPPCSTGIYDETVVLKPVTDGGHVPAIVVSEDAAVRSWAASTFERYRRNAESISPERLDPDHGDTSAADDG